MISLDAINNALEVSKHPISEAKTDDIITAEDCQNAIFSFEDRLKTEVLQLKLDLLPHEDHLFTLADMLNSCPRLDYTQYKQVTTASGKKDSNSSSSKPIPKDLRKYFTANTFLTLPKDKNGNIETLDLLHFIQKSIEAEEVGLNLLRHCIANEDTIHENGNAGWGVHGVSGDSGFITEAELERYIFEQIPRIHSCKSFQFGFYPFYSYAASRRFLFYLDPHRTRRIAIKKLAHSRVMEDFVKLRRRFHPMNNAPNATNRYEGGYTGYGNDVTNNNKKLTETSEEAAAKYADNWFHGAHAEKVYNTYLELDVDANGTLSEDELYHFSGLNPADSLRLTRVAIRRLLEETVTYTPVEMDFKGFLDLVLALENKTAAQSMTYFWNIINVDKTGRLSPHNILYFYKEIYSSLKEHGCDAPEPTGVVFEIFDILSCQNQDGPTLKELIKSGQGHVVLSMLLDVTGFWQYDNRENLIAQQQSTTS